MIVFPNSKINLGLHILRKRDDGYHDIETVFYPVLLRDVLEIIPSPDGKFHFTTHGLNIPDDPVDNLCVKAFNILQEEFNLKSVTMVLLKNIPTGAGLGGGSSDAAFTIRAMNDLFELGLTEEGMMNRAAKLGSDCPFFIRNRPVLATGRGEIFIDLDLDLSKFQILLVKPEISVDTAFAYSLVKPVIPVETLKDVIITSPDHWKEKLTNDFENPVMARYPQIREIRDKLYQLGAVYASMTGSGAAVYGLFRKHINPQRHFPGCFSWCK
ncbi:MAG: 4-(cytidine 5'-diphospho)-2-C-methyl-D-erythritol kinase [Bacteroidetes bacterium]|nr:4-(cytidine 5'-diphospho)-2-C-methyl-D-erythritol kinase [Bacteroidota bacterium]